MGARSIVLTLLVAALAAFLYDRSRILYTFYANTPGRLPSINSFQSHEVKFPNIRNCEDALLLEDKGLALLACDDGREMWNVVQGVYVEGEIPSARLYVYDYAKWKASDASGADTLKEITLVDYNAGADFHTLGMAYDGKTSTLFVTNHAQGGHRVELFKLDTDALTATHMRSISHPLINIPNALHLINSNEFYVTNDHYITTRALRWLSLMETYLGPPGGSVVHVKLDGDKVDAKLVARVPFANGIEILNKTTVAVSASSRAAVYLYTLHDENDYTSLIYKAQIPVPFIPDNLSLSTDGRLLIAGHPHAAIEAKYAATRHICNDEGRLAAADDKMRTYCETMHAPSWVAEWTEEGGLKHLYVGHAYATSATAVRDAERGIGVVAGLYAKGIMIWRD